MDQRRSFTVPTDIVTRSDAEAVTAAVLDVLADAAQRAVVDAYTDHRREMTPEVQAAESLLRSRNERRVRGDVGMGVEVTRDDAEA